MIRFKEGVCLDLTAPAMQTLILALARLSTSDRVTYTVTAGNNGRHTSGSRHYSNEAIDFRTHDLPAGTRAGFCARYQAALGPLFRVLLEDSGLPNEHGHAQVRRGVVYREAAPC